MRKIKFIERLKKRNLEKHFVSEINGKYQKLKVKRALTPEQEREALNYYQQLVGKKVPLDWHRFMYSRTGVWAKDYVPLSLYRSELIGRMNVYPFMDAYADKNVSEMLFPDVRQPRTILKNMRGYFYAGDRPVDREEAVALCQDIPDGIIKPSMSTRGHGVKHLVVSGGMSNIDGKTIEQVMADYKQDYIIQEKIHQHPQMAALNPTSANTIRLLTYRSGMDILVLYTVIRIGKREQVIDNESSGGISARINSDGTLARYAYGAPGNDMVEFTDCGVRLEGYQIPSYDKVVETAKRLHYRLPYFDMAAWDFSVDYDGEPLFIEWNANPDLSQTANGPAFGEYAERIFGEVYKKSNTRNQYW